MTQLPYFIKPFSPLLEARTLVAHKARGFSYFICSPENKPLRTTLDLAHTLGVTKHVSWFPKMLGSTSSLTPFQRDSILKWACDEWRRDLADLRLDWIELEFRHLDEEQRHEAFVRIEEHIWINPDIPITWRAQRMKPVESHMNIPQDILSRLEMSLASLESSLLEKDPMMSQHLRNTHSLLISYPETVHLLSDDEIARIIDAAEMHTKTEIVKAVAKGTSASGSRKKVTADDL